MAEIEDGFENHRVPAIRVPLLSDKMPKDTYGKLVTKAAAEFLGSFLLAFAIAALSATNERSNGAIGLLSFAISAGFTVTVIIFTTGHISGAHVNPSITVGFALSKRFPWSQVPLYVISQISGSVLAILAAKWICSFPGNLALTKPTAGLLQSLVMEAMMSFLVMFLACILSTNSQLTGNAAAIAVPAGIGLSVMIAGPISGASLNPARSLGPAIVANDYNAIWIYIAGPLAGTVLAVMTHEVVMHQL